MNSETILLVEDNPDEVELMCEALAEAGISMPMKVLHDGEEAIAYLQGKGRYADRDAHPLPCLMFLDLKLPLKSGLEVIEWVKVQPKLKRIPVVVVTSSREPNDLTRAYDCGANSYLPKPTQFREFVEMIKVTVTYWINYNKVVGTGMAGY